LASETGDWRVEAGDEWTARCPFGAVKPADASGRAGAADGQRKIVLRAARNAYVSFRLHVSGRGEYALTVEVDPPLEADLYRAWYHKMAVEGAPAWCADALVPVEHGAPQRLPDPDNAVDGHTHQAFWVDVFVPPDTPAGPHAGRVLLNGESALPVRIEVVDQTVPDRDAVIMNSHSFGCRWLDEQYPGAVSGAGEDGRWAKRIELLHHLYRINREHRALLTNRGVGHANTFDRIYGPTLAGAGREKRIADWSWYDRHYGPLLDGAVFRTAGPGAPRPRRPADPPWCVATPMNAEWPADYLYWGQPGYEVEFVRCVRQFDQHWRDRGWTRTHPYFFFVHKKRYRWLEWDGDEPKHAKDHAYFLEMGRLLRAAVDGSPVPWLYRIDASWQMKNEFAELAGLIDWWVCGGFIRWYRDEVAEVVGRGDVVWEYSGLPPIQAASSALLEHVWRAWARGLAGHCYWKAFGSGPDPWFASDGNATQLFYPGERFGIPGPIPSIRLKLQRNAVQDINLLDARPGPARRTLVEHIPVRLWEKPPAVVRQLPPEEWDSRNLSGSQDDRMSETQPLDPLWWADVRAAALEGLP
jgi:hypothetical protein